jgi:hypothetical protein
MRGPLWLRVVFGVLGVVAALAVGLLNKGCITEETGDFALCCTCLAQRSPINDGNAIDPSTNCLPDDQVPNPADPTDPIEAEVDGCNQIAADQILDEQGAPPIFVTDELCTEVTCQAECRGAKLRGARFQVREGSLSG